MGPKLSPDYSWKFVNQPDSAVDGNLLVTTDSKRPSISNYYYYQRIEGSGEGGGTFCSETLRLTDTRFVYLFFHFIPGFVPTTIEPKNNNVLCGFLITRDAPDTDFCRTSDVLWIPSTDYTLTVVKIWKITLQM